MLQLRETRHRTYIILMMNTTPSIKDCDTIYHIIYINMTLNSAYEKDNKVTIITENIRKRMKP
jgi:hypothetical protein